MNCAECHTCEADAHDAFAMDLTGMEVTYLEVEEIDLGVLLQAAQGDRLRCLTEAPRTCRKSRTR
jgi:ferredoxin